MHIYIQLIFVCSYIFVGILANISSLDSKINFRVELLWTTQPNILSSNIYFNVAHESFYHLHYSICTCNIFCALSLYSCSCCLASLVSCLELTKDLSSSLMEAWHLSWDPSRDIISPFLDCLSLSNTCILFNVHYIANLLHIN